MNKIRFSILLLLGFITTSNAQDVVFNEKLLTQLTKNQVVRNLSADSYKTSYEKQQELYELANQKLTQIIAIQEFIYSNLTNINQGIRQGKKLYYLYQYWGKIAANANDVLTLSAQRPEYAILLNRFYIGVSLELIAMQKELREEIMREDKDFLMDHFDREVVVNMLLRRSRLINGYFISIKLRLEQAKKTPYIYQIPGISNYVNLDKMIIKDIIYKYKVMF